MHQPCRYGLGDCRREGPRQPRRIAPPDHDAPALSGEDEALRRELVALLTRKRDLDLDTVRLAKGGTLYVELDRGFVKTPLVVEILDEVDDRRRMQLLARAPQLVRQQWELNERYPEETIGRLKAEMLPQVLLGGDAEGVPQGGAALVAGPAVLPAFQLSHPAVVNVVGG